MKQIFFNVLFLLIVLFQISATQINNMKCDSTTTCLVLHECKVYHNELKNAINTQMRTRVQRKLYKLNCGFIGYESMVCCPKSTNRVGSASDDTTSPLTPVDISKHRNLRLLPTDDCGSDDGDKIFGGEVTGIYDYPWMAIIYKIENGLPNFFCGGSVINERYILTAAHCVGRNTVIIRVGDHDLSSDKDCEGIPETCASPYQDIDVAETIPHPQYNAYTKHNDIALVRLAKEINFTENVQSICLPTTKELLNAKIEGELAVVTGWGITENGYASDVLKKVSLPVVANELCANAYRGVFNIHHLQMCAGGEKGKDSCNGDSGGPLVILKTIKNIQYGVVSMGPTKCGSPGIPGVYARVTHYMKWILDTIKP